MEYRRKQFYALCLEVKGRPGQIRHGLNVRTQLRVRLSRFCGTHVYDARQEYLFYALVNQLLNVPVRDLYGKACLGSYLLYAVSDYLLVRGRGHLHAVSDVVEEGPPKGIHLVHVQYARDAYDGGVLSGNLARVGGVEHLLPLLIQVRKMGELGVVPFYVVLFAPASVVKRRFSLHYDLSNIAYVGAVPALEGLKMVLFLTEVKALENGLCALRHFARRKYGRADSARNVVVLRHGYALSGNVLECRYNAEVCRGAALKEYPVPDAPVSYDPVKVVVYYGV